MKKFGAWTTYHRGAGLWPWSCRQRLCRAWVSSDSGWSRFKPASFLQKSESLHGHNQEMEILSTWQGGVHKQGPSPQERMRTAFFILILLIQSVPNLVYVGWIASHKFHVCCEPQRVIWFSSKLSEDVISQGSQDEFFLDLGEAQTRCLLSLWQKENLDRHTFQTPLYSYGNYWGPKDLLFICIIFT